MRAPFGQSDREVDGLSGDVRSVRVEIVELEGGGPDARSPVESKTFDDRGNTLDWTLYDEAGVASRRYVYTYDAAGRRTASVVTSASDETLETTTYAYDVDGLLAADTITDARRAGVRYAHARSGDARATVTTRSRADGSPGRREEVARDAHGREVEMRVFSPDGKLDHRWLYGYDRAGRRTSEISLHGDGSFRSKEICKYDERGREYKLAVYRADGSLSAKWAYTYEDDDAGNWVRRNVYLKGQNGRYRRAYAVVRTIEYGHP